MAENEEIILHKDVWISVNYNPGVLRGFVFEKEYNITEGMNLLILILQHEYYRFATPEDPAFIHDAHPIPFVDYRVFFWEEIDNDRNEVRGIINGFTNTVTIHEQRSHITRAILKSKLVSDTIYTHYQINLKLVIKEPTELTNISNIIF